MGAAVLVIILIAGGIWYWRNKAVPASSVGTAPAAVSGAPSAEKTGGSVGAAIFEKSQNPIVNKQPETNPFGKVEINPLKSVYTNPFK